jgi:DNA-binding CsgD family transcriptional regulator
MRIPDVEMLSAFATELMDCADLTPAERSEVLNIAHGLACNASAAAEGSSAETVRERRKQVYAKLGVTRAGDLISALQMLPHPPDEIIARLDNSRRQ